MAAVSPPPPPPQKLQTRSPISSRHHPPAPYSESPKISSNLRVLKKGISVLEREFIEFREKTLSSLQRPDDSHLGVKEMYSTVQQQRHQIDELQQAVRELEEDNRSLRETLKRVIEELASTHHSCPTQSPHQEIQQPLHQETQEFLHQETQQRLHHETGSATQTSSTSSTSCPQISPPLSPLDITNQGTQRRRPEPASHNNTEIIFL